MARTPPLRDAHAERGATFTEFGGWEMPVEFDSIRAEHGAVREAAGVFDVSHMGEIEVVGPDATALMDRLVTNDVSGLDPGESRYAAVVDEDGVMLDDTVVYRRRDEDGDPAYLFVPNAGHDAEAHERWTRYRDEWDLDATVRNATEEYAMLAVQGPDAPGLVVDAVDDDPGAVDGLARFEATGASVADVDCWVARTGYTGEDGYELLGPWGEARTLWDAFADDCRPCGLGARDTLRLEMGFLLSGQDFDPEDDPRNPYEADIGFVVDLDGEFVGRDALAAVAEAGVEERLTGLVLQERAVPRHGYEVTDADGDVVGHVTSGTMSPTLGDPIAMAYLPVESTDPGTRVDVVVRGDRKRARTVEPPFVDR
ncbi:MAG: glycine cleavage system aminomethyltransferase GcvT [Haloferacaceae archaeon]